MAWKRPRSALRGAASALSPHKQTIVHQTESFPLKASARALCRGAVSRPLLWWFCEGRRMGTPHRHDGRSVTDGHRRGGSFVGVPHLRTMDDCQVHIKQRIANFSTDTTLAGAQNTRRHLRSRRHTPKQPGKPAVCTTRLLYL